MTKAQETAKLAATFRAELVKATAEQQRLARTLEERAAERLRLEVDWATAAVRFERTLAEERERLRLSEERGEQELASLRARLSEAIADESRLAALQEEREAARHQADARHAEACARLEQTLAEERQLTTRRDEREQKAFSDLASQLSDAREEQARLATRLDERELEARRFDAEKAELCARLEQRLAEDHQRALLVKEHEQRELMANLQGELALAMVEQKRLKTLLSRSQADQRQLAAEHTADRAETERTLGQAILKKNQMLKAFADEKVELQRLQDAARELEPLAAAGRLAIDIGAEFQALASEVDARAKFLLGLCSLDVDYRAEMETLRTDALRAASLARQLALMNFRQPAPESPEDR